MAMKVITPSKYGNNNFGGFDSNFEKKYAQSLDLLCSAGDIMGYEMQQTIEIESPLTGKLICKYRCDFKVYHLNQLIEWIETKGFETADWRIKRRLMEEIYIPQNPDQIFKVVKMNKYKEPDYFPFRRPSF